MLQALWGAPPEVRPVPGLLHLWSAADLRTACHTGDVSGLSKQLLPCDAAEGAVLMAFQASCSLHPSGALGFVSTLLLLHSDKPDTCSFALRFLGLLLTPETPRGALSSFARPAVSALDTLEAHHDKLSTVESQKWLGAVPTKADDYVVDALIPAMCVFADFVDQLCTFGDTTVVLGVPIAPSVHFIGDVLRRRGPEVRPALAAVLRPVLASIHRALDGLHRLHNEQSVTDVATVVCAALDMVALAGRCIAARDIPTALELISRCVSLSVTAASGSGDVPVASATTQDVVPGGSGPAALAKAISRINAAGCWTTASLWKDQVVHTTLKQVTELRNAASNAARTASSEGLVAAFRALRLLFASTTFPPIDDLDATLLTWFASSVAKLTQADADAFAAAAATVVRWHELAGNKTLPRPTALLLRVRCVEAAAHLITGGLASWPLGVGSAWDTAKHGPVVEAIASLVPLVREPILSTDQQSREQGCRWCDSPLYDAVTAHASSVVLHHAPATAALCCAFATHQVTVHGAAAHEAWRSMTLYAQHVERGVLLLGGSAAGTEQQAALFATCASSAAEALLLTGADAKLQMPADAPLRTSIACDMALRLMAATETIKTRAATTACIDVACAELLWTLANQPGLLGEQGIDTIAAVPPHLLRALAQTYAKHRGWLWDGAVVKRLLDLMALPRLVRTLRLRPDVVRCIALRDPAVRTALELGLAALTWSIRRREASTVAAMDGDEARRPTRTALPTSVARRIVAFSGDGAAVAAAFAAGGGHNLLLSFLQ